MERPMKHAVIFAHPGPQNLNHAIAATYADGVEGLGHEVIVRDLYAMGFDPCLKASEIPGPGLPDFEPEIRRERARL